ncbi:amidohydrolase family protein [Litorihabitans aurantiacus]|uniref:Cytosine deaminase n=1 Tax=Litorihabitans aurantiacus TaxID=1930061 RepID=A0AA37UQ68_9MICO|nr:amidohydrolase family protein [Litorihabitans aurantiacus]GMA31031.1 cytosine deaminase [Litorihabitans aurantiacus]
MLSGLRGVRLLDDGVADVRIAGAVVVDPSGAGDAAGKSAGVVLDATSWRLVPGPVEPHAHLDKALTAGRIPPGAGLDLVGAVESWRALAPGIDAADVRHRALAALRRYLARGFTGVRTHVNLDAGGDPLAAVRVLVGLREELREVLTLQVCLLPSERADDALIRDAIALGPDALGGCPHLAADPRAETGRLLDLAQESGLPLDLHTDEQVDPGSLDLLDLAHEVLRRDLRTPVTASHCVRLGSLEPARLAEVLDVVGRAGVAVVGLPQTNLYLQGWDATHLVPRGITAARALLDAGITFGAGGDNLRDPFNPVGRADPFETASLLVAGAHLRPREALDAVTAGARAATGMPVAGTDTGDEASFVLVPDSDLGDVVAGTHDARVVVHRGRVVADTRVASSLALDTTHPTPTPGR